MSGGGKVDTLTAGGRQMSRRVVGWVAGASLMLFAGCGGGGGGGDSSGGTGGVPTPLPNHVCDSTNRVCISVDRLLILVGQTVVFTAEVKSSSGAAQQGVQGVVTGGTPGNIAHPRGPTDENGLLHGSVTGVLGGSTLITAEVPGLSTPDNPVRASVRVS